MTRLYDDGSNVRVRFDGVEAETDAAYLLSVDGEEVWIPKSQIAHMDDSAGELWIPLWLAEKKELDYD